MSKELESSRIPTPLSQPEKRQEEEFKQQKEETVSILMRSYEDGELTIEEYDERLTLAMDANTHQELDVLTVELKEQLAGVEHPNELSTDADPKTTERAKPVKQTTVLATTTNRQTAIFGVVKKEGPWRLSSRVDSQAIFGAVRLDLRDVEWVDLHTVIQCKAVFGSIVVIVPPGVSVDCKGVGILGSFAKRNKIKASNSKYRLTIRGIAVFGSIEVLFDDEDSEDSEDEYYTKRAQRSSIHDEDSEADSDSDN